MAGGYCSGTVIGPRLQDGRWNIVSAAHCVKRVGERVTFIPRNGRAPVPCLVGSIDRRADVAILITEHSVDLAHTLLAEAPIVIGLPVWHSGFGIDQPGNRESGQVTALANGDGQVQYRISVSPGDSGGGILTTADGLLLSPVCCTTNLARIGNVWGGGPGVIRRMIANPTAFLDLPPIAMPSPPSTP